MLLSLSLFNYDEQLIENAKSTWHTILNKDWLQIFYAKTLYTRTELLIIHNTGKESGELRQILRDLYKERIPYTHKLMFIWTNDRTFYRWIHKNERHRHFTKSVSQFGCDERSIQSFIDKYS